MNTVRRFAYRMLRWSERYTKTDMVFLAKTGFWSNSGVLVAALFGLGLYVIFGRYLSQEMYGTYQYLLAVSVFLNAFTLTGMNAAITRSVARGYEGVLRRAVQLQLKYALIPAAFSILLSAYYAHAGNNTLAIGLLILGLTTPFTNAFNSYSAFFTGKQDYRRGFIYNAVGNVPYYGAIALAAIFARSALPILAANCIVNLIVQFIAYRHSFSKHIHNDSDDPGAYRFGMHLSAMNVPIVMLAQIDSILAFHFIGAAGLALYSFSTGIPDQAARFLKFIPTAALPRFALGNESAVRGMLLRRVLQLAVGGGVLALLYIVSAHFLFAFLFPNYIEAVWFSRIYALSLISIPTGLVSSALMAHGRVQSLYVFNIGTAVLQTSLQLAGIIFGGLTGLIAGKVIASFLALMIALLLYFMRNGIQKDLTPDA